MNEIQRDILNKLSAVRRRVRFLLAAEGAAVLLTASLVCGVTFALLDWWVDFPGLIRVLALAVGCGVGAGWIWRRIVRPLTLAIPLEQLALRLGVMNPDERDELASAVEFLDGHGSGSPEIWERVVALTSEHSTGSSWVRGLNPQRSARSVGAAVVLFGAVAWSAYALPELADIGRTRLLAPWVSVEWPRRVQIVAETRDMMTAFGESVTTAMRVSRGDDPFLRAFVEWGPAGGEKRKSLMQREADGTFRFTIENVRTPLEYVFSAGDDDTRRRPFRVMVARRPEAAAARLVIRPPAYARDEASVSHELAGSPVSVVRGSHAKIDVVTRRSESPVQEGEVYFAGNDVRIALAADSGNPGGFKAEFDIVESGSFGIRLRDSGGLESREERMYELVVTEDEPPSVEIISPSDDIDMTPRGVMEIRVHGSDDFGLAAMTVVAGIDGAPLSTAFELLGDEKEMAQSRLPIREADRTSSWRLGLMEPRIEAGSVIEFAAEVRDVFDLNGERHDAKRSATRRIRVISESQFAESLRQSLTTAAARLRRLASVLQTVRSETARLSEGPSVRRAMGEAERERASQLSREMRRIAKASREVSVQLEEIATRADENRASRLDVAMQAKRLARSMQQLARGSMRGAGSALSTASEAKRFEEQAAALATALAAEEQSLAEMADMLDSLERWNEFADMARLLRELLDRQEDLERVCSKLARGQSGRSIEELSDAEASGLMDARMSQQRLRDESSAVVRAMREMAASVASSDGAAATSLDRAVDQATRTAVLEHMATATGEIEKARLRKARESQNKAIVGLRAMLAAMDERPERELAALAKELSDFVARLQRLVREQEKLIDDTQAAQGQSTESAMNARLAGRQRTLAKTCEGISGGTIGVEGMSVKFALLTAVAHMGAASAMLDRGDPSSSIDEQENARTQLIEAIDALKEIQERGEKELAERSLAAILDAMTSIRDSQQDLHQETSAIGDRQRGGARVGRADGVKLKALAKKQGELASTLVDVMERMKGSIVFRRVCERTGERMTAAKARLDAREARDAATEQSAALANLDRLITVLDSKPKKKGEQFVDQDSGGEGGGAGDPTMTRPVPPLAELKMLRVLQLELNERTRKLNDALPSEFKRTEGQLKDLERLGEEQREIHEMSVKMIEGQSGD